VEVKLKRIAYIRHATLK